jgi:hypothetical protein
LKNTAEDLLQFSKTVDSDVKKHVSELKAIGVKVIVTPGNFGVKYMEYFNARKMLVVKLGSKSEILRLHHICKIIDDQAQAQAVSYFALLKVFHLFSGHTKQEISSTVC